MLERQLHKRAGIASIRLEGGSLTRLPSAPALWQPLSASLTSLSINGNNLIELPNAMQRCQLLRTLRLHNNLLKSLPGVVLHLRILRELDVSSNCLSGLPDSFGALRKLVRLLLARNEISYLPTSLGRLRRLQHMDLSENAIHEIVSLSPCVCRGVGLQCAHERSVSPMCCSRMKLASFLPSVVSGWARIRCRFFLNSVPLPS